MEKLNGGLQVFGGRRRYIHTVLHDKALKTDHSDGGMTLEMYFILLAYPLQV